ncbi:MAG: hypothetical protein JWO73_368 [Candidatus Taylorbacteria bacterium]|nr:hypothetical protein [Candidatus Taylorbacteria bacterium]
MEINFLQKKRAGSREAGFTLIEALVYISLLVVIMLLMVNTLLSFNDSYRKLGALRIAEHAGTDAMERMVRDIRAAASIDTANSTLGSTPGVLALTNTGTTTKFYIQSGILKVDVNGAYSGPLTVSGASVTSLTFTQLTSSSTSAVKIDLTVTGTSGSVTKTKQYHSTVIMKGI